jgi:hypothetical protein
VRLQPRLTAEGAVLTGLCEICTFVEFTFLPLAYYKKAP